MIKVENVSKTYQGGFTALQDVNLEIKKGEIFALLGPNGAGKTTLISIICGISNLSSGKISVDGFDIHNDYREARSRVGLVPQELTTDMFEKVISTVKFSRHLFGKKTDPARIEKILKALTLWDKRDSKIMTLSGGMKRRVMIAKALAHEPQVLFLDEPTAGVDVELRQEMWAMVRELRETGVTVILTTHYIEEAQEMADRIGIIHKGKIILVEDKKALLKKLGKKQMILTLKSPLEKDLADLGVSVSEDKNTLTFEFNSSDENTGISDLLKKLEERGIEYKDLKTKESSLEDIFVGLTGKKS